MLNVVQNYQKTNYPEIFKDIYWGLSEYSSIDNSIISNRNKLVEENNIIKPIKLGVFVEEPAFLDHTEAYLTKSEKVIFFFSPYDGDICDKLREFIHYNKFTNVEKLYHRWAKTYLKEFKNKSEFNAWKKLLDQIKRI